MGKSFFIIVFLLFASQLNAQYRPGAFWQVVGAAPVCTVVTPPTGWRQNASETINFNCVNNYLMNDRECQVNGGAWGSCTSATSHVISGLTTGSSNSFSVRVMDYYGKYSTVDVNSSTAWQTDLVNPTCTISTAISGWRANASETINFACSDADSGIASVQCQINGGAWGTCSGGATSHTFSGLTNASSSSISVRATDNSGRVSTVVSRNWSTDLVNPTCTISTAISGWRTNASEAIAFTCTDSGSAVASVQCRINAGAWGACSGGNTSHTESGLVSGDVTTVEVRATDSAGRTSTVVSRTWSTDLTIPTVTIGAVSGTNTGAPSIAFTGADANSGVAGFECSIDTGTAAYSPCTSPRTGTTTTAGVAYFFRVRATDNAGLVSAVETRTWTNGNWTAFGACSVACGGGTQTRTCTNPAPSASPAGMPCAGSGSEACNTAPCCTNANSTTNMCPGRKFFVNYLAAGACAPSITADSATLVSLCPDLACATTLPDGTVNSCASGSVAQTNFNNPNKYQFTYECTCN